VAASLNRVILIGNLTRDPELRYLSSGTAVATFSIAVNRTYTAQTGEKKEEVTFVRIVTWDKRAEVCNEYLKKGSPVCVEGRLQSRTWEAPDGAKRSTIEVIASNVQFLNRSSGNRVTSDAETQEQSVSEEVPPAEALTEKHNEEVPF
jgi:single-strand DNA-binding protein